MIDVEIIKRHTTCAGFDSMYAEFRNSERVGFLCSYVNPDLMCCQILDCPEQEIARIELEKRGYVLADYRMYNKSIPQQKINAEKNLRRFQSDIRSDLEYLRCKNELGDDWQYLRLPKRGYPPADRHNIALSVMLAHASIDGD